MRIVFNSPYLLKVPVMGGSNIALQNDTFIEFEIPQGFEAPIVFNGTLVKFKFCLHALSIWINLPYGSSDGSYCVSY
jgi:hypothetical protein